MKPRISIVTLIYKSPKYADFIYDAMHNNTPELKTGEAEFYFVLNFKQGESENVFLHLEKKLYKYFNFNKNYTQPDYPKNIGSIYEAWNYAVTCAKGEIVVLLNSDMIPSDSNWLADMLKCLSKKTVITSRLIESGKIPSGQHAISKNFGQTIDSFDEKGFRLFASTLKNYPLRDGGLYMPMMIHKENFLKVRGYSDINPYGTSGDKGFFDRLSKEFGVRHMTSFDSIFYHFQEGEVDSIDYRPMSSTDGERCYWQEVGICPAGRPADAHWNIYTKAAKILKRRYKVLDVGCGCGAGSVILAKKCAKVIAMDLSSKAIKFAKSFNQMDNIEFSEANLEKIDLGKYEKKFDAVFAIEVIEHLDDSRGVIDKLLKTLKSSGQLIMTFPVDSGGGFHKTNFTKENIDSYLKGLIYSIEYIQPGERIPTENFYIIIEGNK